MIIKPGASIFFYGQAVNIGETKRHEGYAFRFHFNPNNLIVGLDSVALEEQG